MRLQFVTAFKYTAQQTLAVSVDERAKFIALTIVYASCAMIALHRANGSVNVSSVQNLFQHSYLTHLAGYDITSSYRR